MAFLYYIIVSLQFYIHHHHGNTDIFYNAPAQILHTHLHQDSSHRCSSHIPRHKSNRHKYHSHSLLFTFHFHVFCSFFLPFTEISTSITKMHINPVKSHRLNPFLKTNTETSAAVTGSAKPYKIPFEGPI